MATSGTPATPAPVTLTVNVTGFKNVHAREMQTFEGSWDRVVKSIDDPEEFPSKDACPLLSLVKFGDKPTEKGSLRHDQNVISIHGIIGDYDGGDVSIEDAAHRLEAAGAEAIIYTSARHTDAKPRWRVIAPLRRPHHPTDHNHLVDVLNGALEGILNPESWTLSQSYYFGKVKGAPYVSRRIKGACLDDLDALDMIAPIAKTKGPSKKVATDALATDLDRTIALSRVTDATLQELRSALAAIPSDDRGLWVRLGHALRGLDAGRELWIEWSRKSAKYDDDDADRVWQSLTGDRTDYRSIFSEAQRRGWVNPRSAAAEPGPAVPQAQHLATDLANANRIKNRFGHELMVAADRWHKWNGTHWASDDGGAFRCSCNLSKFIEEEAATWRSKPVASAEERTKNAEIADALQKWSKRSEDKGTIEAAFGILKKLLTIEVAKLDADPWLLNCQNGTVDLRTGELRAHRAADYITKIALVHYDPEAPAPRFQRFLEQITRTQDDPLLAPFLARWFGYCATGSTREQKLVVHYGSGANGKSTLLQCVADVLGDYAGTAAPGLLVGNGSERHPTEIADLRGQRMVTAHESDDGAVLREGFVKQATGGDKLKGRYMRGDFFEYAPTHKLQLLTNHKPQVKGQDFAIWRRLLLVPYTVVFGTPEEIGEGRAHHPRDESLMDALRQERAGILAWIVKGAVSWHRGGLQAPMCVLSAGKDYQREQDRVGQFIAECCDLDANRYVPLSLPGAGGLYGEYVRWCKESGCQPLSKQRLLPELERVIPGFRLERRKTAGGREQRRDFRAIWGVKGFGSLEFES